MYELSVDMLESQVTIGKNIILDRLYKDGVITAEEYKHYSMNYAIVLRKPSFFSMLWKKDQSPSYTLVRQLSWNDEENHKEEPPLKLEVIDIKKLKESRDKKE